MADLTEQQSAQTVKITGSDNLGVEDNYLNIDSSGRITVNQGVAGSANWLTNIAAFGGSAVTLGQTTMASSIPVAIASNQSAIPVTQSGTWTVQQGTPPWTINLTQVGGSALALGQTTMASSIPVTFASNQSALTITGTVTANLSGTGTLADNAAFTDGTTRVVMSGHILDETAGTALTENDAAASRIDSKRAQIMVIEDATTRGRRLTITASNAMVVDGSAVTQPISATSLPLPTGAATETTLTGVLTTSAFQARINTLGQKTMANSTPVVLASDQTAIPVTQSGTWTTTVTQATGTNLHVVVDSGTVAATQSGTWNINNISGTISLPTGAATSALQTTGNTSLSTIVTNTTGLTVAQSSTTSGQNGQLVMGAVTTSAPTYTTGQTNPLSLSTNGSLRVDGSGTTQPISGTVTANQGTANTNANAWPVKEVKAATTAITSTTASTSNVTLKASNANRLGLTVYNDASKTLYLKLGATASTSSYTVKLVKDAYYEMPFGYTGIVDGIWDTGVSGSALVTEITI